MSALPDVGQLFLDFVLGDFDSRKERAGKPVLAIFWRTGCSTCAFSMPFFDRLYRAYPDALIIGVSQDSRMETDEYCLEKDVRMPQIIDKDLAASRMYGTKTVPTYVLADSDGIVRLSGFSWSRENVEDMSRLLAEMTGKAFRQIVQESDQAPAFKPG